MPCKDTISRREYNKRYYNEKKKAKDCFCDGIEPIIEAETLSTILEEPLEEVSVSILDDNYEYLKAKSKITKDYENWSYYISRVNTELLRKKSLWGRLFW